MSNNKNKKSKVVRALKHSMDAAVPPIPEGTVVRFFLDEGSVERTKMVLYVGIKTGNVWHIAGDGNRDGDEFTPATFAGILGNATRREVASEWEWLA